MRLLSINVAQPELVRMGERSVLTGIYKRRVEGPRRLGALGFDGDGQADLTVHGGEYQAAYGYPFEHYEYWERTLAAGPFEPGTFGENITTSGLLETEVCLGDRFKMGSAVLELTSPRLPCFKFAHKMGRPDILKPFLQSGRSGFYFRVVETGELAEGDAIELISRPAETITLRALLGLMRFGEGDVAMVRRALGVECLAPPVRHELEKRLAAS